MNRRRFLACLACAPVMRVPPASRVTESLQAVVRYGIKRAHYDPSRVRITFEVVVLGDIQTLEIKGFVSE